MSDPKMLEVIGLISPVGNDDEGAISSEEIARHDIESAQVVGYLTSWLNEIGQAISALIPVGKGIGIIIKQDDEDPESLTLSIIGLKACEVTP